MGRLTNGALLTQAEAAGFSVFVTGDQNLEYQQDLSQRRLGVALDNLAKEMEVVRRRLGLGGGGPGGGGGFGGGTENVRGRIGQLKGAVIGSTSVPTNTQLQQIREVKAALPIVIDQAHAVAATLPGLVKEMLGAGAIVPALKPVAK